MRPKTSYTGQQVFMANQAGLNQTKPTKRPVPPDNRPSKELILDKFTQAVADGDIDQQNLWIGIWEDSGYTFD